jgi:integrase
LRGRQHVLAAGPDDSPKGPTYLAALTAFKDLLSLDNADKAGDSNTCRVVLEHFLRAQAAQNKPSTLRIRQEDLTAFCRTQLADCRVKELTPFAVQQWLNEMRKPRHSEKANRVCKWGNAKIRNVITSLQTAFNWAVQQQLITANPLKGMKRPSARSRGRDCIVSPQDHERILAAASARVRPFIVCLENTGCRPGELLGGTAADWNDALGALVSHAEDRRLEDEFSHKTGRKGKDRRIFFTGEALAIMRALVVKYPHGPLWRNPKPKNGKPDAWTMEEVAQRFRYIRKKVGLPRLTSYSYRHTYATRWLEQGGAIDDLAELLGNSPEIIRKHYNHLCGNLERLRELAERFQLQTIPTEQASAHSGDLFP